MLLYEVLIHGKIRHYAAVPAERQEARQRWGLALDADKIRVLRASTAQFRFVLSAGDLLLMDRGWYVTHAGLLRLAARRRCKGIRVAPVEKFSEPAAHRLRLRPQSIRPLPRSDLSATAMLIHQMS